MSSEVAALLFVISLAVTLAASEAMVRGLDRLGARLGFSGALLGLLTALGADAPEIASAVASLQARARDVGLGVVLGSNIFNLAALLGLSAILAGRGDVLLMRPLLAHNSGNSHPQTKRHRRATSASCCLWPCCQCRWRCPSRSTRSQSTSSSL